MTDSSTLLSQELQELNEWILDQMYPHTVATAISPPTSSIVNKDTIEKMSHRQVEPSPHASRQECIDALIDAVAAAVNASNSGRILLGHATEILMRDDAYVRSIGLASGDIRSFLVRYSANRFDVIRNFLLLPVRPSGVDNKGRRVLATIPYERMVEAAVAQLKRMPDGTMPVPTLLFSLCDVFGCSTERNSMRISAIRDLLLLDSRLSLHQKGMRDFLQVKMA